MAIIFTQKPNSIITAYNDIIIECYESTNTSTITSYTIKINSDKYEIEPNVDGKCYINLSKIIASNISSEFASSDSFYTLIEPYSFWMTVYSYTSGNLVSYNTVSQHTVLNAAYQSYDGTFNAYDYLPITDTYSKWLNKTDGGLSVAVDGKLTIQYLNLETSNAYSLSGLYINVFNKDWQLEGDEITTPITFSVNEGIVCFDVSPSRLDGLYDIHITEDTMYYTIEAMDGELETIRVNVDKVDNRFPTPTRLAYINSMGATDYFTFKLADTNKLAISKNTYLVNGVETDYSTEVVNTRNLIGNYTSEKRIKSLSDLWYSPMVISLTDNDVKVRVIDKKVTINKRRNNKQFTPTATIKFADEFRVLQQ